VALERFERVFESKEYGGDGSWYLPSVV